MTYDVSVIQHNNSFDPKDFPEVCEELESIKKSIVHEPVYFKVEILVSFIRNHCLRTGWIDANPSLSKMLTSGALKISLLEALFASGKKNSNFLTTLENYIRRQILTPVVPSSL